MQYNNKNRKEKSNLTKQKIYSSAAKLFTLNRVDKVTIDAIVKDAGVAKGSFYLHFPSKNALITALIFENVKKTDKRYFEYINSLPADYTAEAMFISLVENIADELTNVIGYDKMKAVYVAQLVEKIDDNALIDYNRSLYKLFSEIFKRGIDSGEFKTNLSVDMLAIQSMVFYRGVTYEWCVRYPNFNLKSQAVEGFKLFLKLLKASKNSI